MQSPSGRGKRFLDVGCGFGYLLDVAQDSGFEVAGVEFNPSAVEHARQKYVFPLFQGDFLDFTDDQPFDAVSMMDVIEHFIDPHEALAKASQLLAPGGILAISTMDSDSFVSRLLGTALEDFRRVREHVSFFTRKSIRRFLEHYGFDVLDIRYHGHTFRYDFLVDRIKLVSPTVGAMAGAVVKCLFLGKRHININPRTKILVFARKRADDEVSHQSGSYESDESR